MVDVGGNAVGARVLARFRDQITDDSYAMWLVVNANRYESQTTNQVLEFAQEIQDACKLSITGLINNTHMLQETTLEDILRGDAVVREVSKDADPMSLLYLSSRVDGDLQSTEAVPGR